MVLNGQCYSYVVEAILNHDASFQDVRDFKSLVTVSMTLTIRYKA